MANNINGGAPNAVVAKTTVSFVTAGISALNTEIIYLVDDPLKSYVPGRAINGISGFETGKGYYMVAKVDMDLTSYLIPPIVGITQLSAPGSFNASAVSDTQINLSWAAVANATNYVVDRATNVGFTTGVNLAIYSGSGTSFNNTGLTATTAYYYRIRATAAGYIDSDYSTANATTQAAGGYDTDAQAYFNAAGITNTTHKDAFDDFVTGLKSAGLWTSKMRAFWPLYGTTLAEAKFNLRNPVDTDGGYRLTQNGSVTISNGALVTTGGETDGFDTHFSATDAGIAQNDNCQFVSVKTNVSELKCPFGTMNPGGTCANYIVPNQTGTALWIANMTNAPDTSQASGGSSIGRYYYSRLNGTQVEIFKNGTSLATVASNSAAPVSGSFYICNGGNGGLAPSTARVSMAGIFKGLTGSEVTALDALVAALETALGR